MTEQTEKKTRRQIDRQIIALSVPAVIATITTPLLGLMDTAFTGHMGGAVYLAAIALGGNVFNLLYWLFGFLRMGTSGFTAQAYGAGDSHGTATALMRGLTVAVMLGAVIVILQRPIIGLFGMVMDPEADAWSEALTYLHILAWGAPAVLTTTVMTGWLIGMNNTRTAMWMSIAIDVVNLAVSAALVLGLHMKVEGVAIGTLSAQWAGVIIGAVMIARYKLSLRIGIGELFEKRAMKRYFSVNGDIFLRTLCLIGVTLWFTRAGAEQGTVTLAANAMLMQLFILFSYFMDGVAYAAEAMAGKAAGAHDDRGLRDVIGGVMRLGSLLALIFAVLYFTAGEWILELLSDDTGVTDAARDYLPWTVAVPIVSFGAFMWDGICVGTTMTRRMLLSMAVATLVYFIIYFTAVPCLGNHGLWLAFTAYLASRSAVMAAAEKLHRVRT